MYGSIATKVIQNYAMKHTDELVTVYPRKSWDKRGLGQETESTRRNLEQKGSPKGQIVELDLLKIFEIS